jgi:hypothetical protein|mmetsp:Transcript_32766/g.53499  ORF Transcript_32766/g.53499 Transcript_32766/m.53499 type:complete len:126 (-) Transcript_32766:1420-1797(-)
MNGLWGSWSGEKAKLSIIDQSLTCIPSKAMLSLLLAIVCTHAYAILTKQEIQICGIEQTLTLLLSPRSMPPLGQPTAEANGHPKRQKLRAHIAMEQAQGHRKTFPGRWVLKRESKGDEFLHPDGT